MTKTCNTEKRCYEERRNDVTFFTAKAYVHKDLL